MRLTQSAASHQLRKAEESLGVKLFQRSGKYMTPTAPGRRIIDVADQVLDLVDSVQLDIASAAHAGKSSHDRVIENENATARDDDPAAA